MGGEDQPEDRSREPMAVRKGDKALFGFVPPEMHEAMRQLAFDERVPIAEVTRRAITCYIAGRAKRPLHRDVVEEHPEGEAIT